MGDFQILIEAELRKCSVVELRLIGAGINIEAGEIGDDKSKAQVMRVITDVFDGLPDDDQKRTTVMRLLPHAPLEIQNSIMSLLTMKPTDPKPPTSNEHLQQTLELLKGMGLTAAFSSKFKKELKISTIDESSSESLNYISLCSEINDGRIKGYTEEEIRMALRKAVAARSSLRTIFDAQEDMSLESMLSFIRTVLKEKSAAELKQDLDRECQKGDDTPQTFVLRAIRLREQVLKAAKAEESTEFDRKGVQEVFLKTVRTGMKDNNVKSQIEPLVKRTSTSSDDDIIKELNLIVSEEEIRRKKLEEEMKRKTASVNETHLTSAGQNLDTHSSTQNSAVMNPVQNTMQNPAVMNSMQNPSGMSPFMDVVKELRDEVKCLRVEVNDLREKSERGAPANRTKKSWGCDYCKKNQKGHLCRHCFRCGAGDHKIQDCPQPREHPLNH